MGPITAGEYVDFLVTGSNGSCTNIPANVTAVSLNVTTTDGTAQSFLTIYPTGSAIPNASTNNWIGGDPPNPNKVDVKVGMYDPPRPGASPMISVINHAGTVNVILDLVGYYVPA